MDKWSVIGGLGLAMIVGALLLGSEYLATVAYEKCLEVQKVGCVR